MKWTAKLLDTKLILLYEHTSNFWINKNNLLPIYLNEHIVIAQYNNIWFWFNQTNITIIWWASLMFMYTL